MSVGVLCIHGFSGGPYEIEPFTAYLRAHTDWLIEELLYQVTVRNYRCKALLLSIG